MHLVIDIGNTRGKWAVFNQFEMVAHADFDKIESIDFAFIKQQYEIRDAILASVRKADENEFELLSKHFKCIRFTTAIGLAKVKSNYSTQSSLGLDRWASVLAVHQLFLGQECLIIDAGTCITYDLYLAQTYLGGNISPGFQMRMNAMYQFTGKLPSFVFDQKQSELSLGLSTEKALLNGAYQGGIYEIEGYIRHYSAQYPNLKIVFTGGDAEFLVNHFKNSIFAPYIIYRPFLVLEGLNSALLHTYAEN